MYRTFLLVLLSTHAALGAPQERDSSITYLKIESPSTDRPIDSQNYRNYRVVPSKSAKKLSKNQSNPIVSDDNQNNPRNPPELKAKLTKPTDTFDNNPTDLPYAANTENIPKKNVAYSNISNSNPSNENVSKSNQAEESGVELKTVEISPENLEKSDSNPEIEESKDHKNLLKDTFDNLDNDHSESSKFDRHSRDYDYTTTTYDSVETEISDYSTERYENLDDTKTSAKVSPKLTYFQKFGGSFSNNLIESSGKRRFRSRCRCEKIWNCPKLQITVPRCPEEYFMCCF